MFWNRWVCNSSDLENQLCVGSDGVLSELSCRLRLYLHYGDVYIGCVGFGLITSCPFVYRWCDRWIAMRKNQFIGFAFVSVCLWALVTYYLFLDRPLNHKPDQVSDHTNSFHLHGSVCDLNSATKGCIAINIPSAPCLTLRHGKV